MDGKRLGYVLAAVAVVLGGCGGDGSPPPSPTGGAVGTSKPSVEAAREYARAVENDDAEQARVWGARALAEAFPDDSAKGLRVDPHIFAPYPKDETSVLGFDTSILVRTSQRARARA